MSNEQKKVMAHGCFDVLHGGHVEYFSQAKALGDYLIVCVASDESLWIHKRKKPSIPLQHRVKLISSLKMVNEVVISSGTELGLDFEPELIKLKPDILVATEDDKYVQKKRELCGKLGISYEQLPKTLDYERISTSEILSFIRAPLQVPLRVDLAGGWLDVPKYALSEGFIVNCSISPQVSLRDWGYKQGAGLGGSAAYALLTGKDAFKSELAMGVGWQDPAVITETGLCVWKSGLTPVLEIKCNPDILVDRIALLWLGESHYTPGLVDRPRDFEIIKDAGDTAREAVLVKSWSLLNTAINLSYRAQKREGMKDLPNYHEVSKKYCGGGFGGYALYLFKDKEKRDEFLTIPNTTEIQPYIRNGGDYA